VVVANIRLNGEDRAFEGAETVAALIDLRKPRPPFAVELNKRLIRHGEYTATPLKDGDQVEIVTLVGGG
jgi:thiamine biosynthesis protein ThiS